MSERTDSSSLATRSCDYIQTLCRNPLPGPLLGGSDGIKELNKWIDERITSSEFPGMDYRKWEVLKLLLLLKIACQYYGKLRSPFGAKTLLKSSPTSACQYIQALLGGFEKKYEEQAYGVHMNGYLEKDEQKFLWVGKRSEQKSTFPGMLYHLVAGGLVCNTLQGAMGIVMVEDVMIYLQNSVT